MANANTNTTSNPNLHNMQDYYDRKLLETAKTRFCHANFGQKRPIPRNSGKRVEFRRWNLFDVKDAITPLTEGVTPNGQSLSQSNVDATVKQYGAYVEVTDLLDMTAHDPVVSDSAELLGEQLGTVVEWVTRDAMNAGTNALYANDRASRLTVTSSDKLTVTEIRKAVKKLKKQKARMYSTGGKKPHFICICSPDATYDLQNDTLWQDVSKYANAEQIYSGEIGRLFGVVFVESTEAKVFKQSVLNAVNTSTTSSAEFVLKNDPTAEEVAYLSTGGNKIKIGTTEYTLASSGSYTAATKTVKLSAAASLAGDAIVYSEDAGACDATTKEGIDIHSTLVFGADAYGVVDIAGSSAVKTIIKPQGSGGSVDPLDQRATVGAKVSAYAATILNNNWIVRIEHAVS